jgi:hypothetical protein
MKKRNVISMEIFARDDEIALRWARVVHTEGISEKRRKLNTKSGLNRSQKDFSQRHFNYSSAFVEINIVSKRV